MTTYYAEIESRPWDDVMDEHLSLLRDQLAYLASESAYYRERFDEWGVEPDAVETFEDFGEIPFTTKDDERVAQEAVTRDEPLGPHQAADRASLNRVMSSSGTTGEPTFFGLTSGDLVAWREMCARACYANGVRPEDVVVHANGRTMVPGTLPYVEGLTDIGATVVPAGSESSERILETVERLDADVLFTTASHLQYLVTRAPEVVGEPVSDLSVRKLVGGGEPGTSDPEIRAHLHEAWDADVVTETMGIGDVAAAVAGECTEEDGMHLVCQGYVHVELVDPDTGERVPMEAGAEGELVYTPLGREATPLLRFRSGDYARVVDRSINSTLSRTFVTSGTTLIVVLTLFIFGGEVLRGFAFALIVGIVIGTYSSVFVASPVLVELKQRALAKA